LQIHRVVVDVHELLGHSEEIVRSEAVDQGRVVEFRLEAREYHVMADPTRLQQVFWNLIKNALKFSEEGGRVTVRTLNPSPHRFAVCVTDNGIGIPLEALDRIFSAFDQGDLKGRHRFGGLGLGLAISKGIVDLHSGSLRVESEGHGRGATFTVELETTVPEHHRESPSQSLPAQTRPIRLLIVEDNEPTLATMKRLLERSGHRVCTAATVSEALAVASANKCDLLVSDLGLPDGSGLDLMREIHQRYGWPGIALTGYGMEEDIRRVTECGFGAHLVKPIDIAQLRVTIERLLAETEMSEELSPFGKNGGQRKSRARSENPGGG
jgi:CheY-like chemotaxis protein